MKPFIHLECLGTFAKLRKAVDTDYFEKLIQEYLLDNTHGSSVTVKPKRGLGNERRLWQRSFPITRHLFRMKRLRS